MTVVKKLSMSYSASEDRIRMVGEVPEGYPVAFWLTQRLGIRLVQAMVRYLHKTAESTPLESQIQQSCRQQAAEWALKSAQPVTCSAGMTEVLLTSIDVSSGRDGVVLKLPGGDEHIQLIMNSRELRQWLGALYRLFRKAGWELDVWPAWFGKEMIDRSYN